MNCKILINARMILTLSIMAILLIIIFKFNIFATINEEWVDLNIRNYGLKGVLLYIFICTVLTGIGVPRQILSFLGGYVYGVLEGVLWATIATCISCSLCFLYARYMGKDFVQKKWGNKLHNFNSFICQSPFLLTIIVRIIPLGSNFITNFLAGISQIPALAFLGGSFLGFSIQNLIFALLGSGVRMPTSYTTALSIILYVISLSLGYWIYCRYKKHSLKYS